MGVPPDMTGDIGWTKHVTHVCVGRGFLSLELKLRIQESARDKRNRRRVTSDERGIWEKGTFKTWDGAARLIFSSGKCAMPTLISGVVGNG